jgi:hypothetical protein
MVSMYSLFFKSRPTAFLLKICLTTLAIFLVFVLFANVSVFADDVPGCTDSSYAEYNSSATMDDGSCMTLLVYGCTDSSASNYNSSANIDDSTCSYYVYGCTNSSYVEYDPLANYDNGSCSTYINYGCTDSSASNYNSSANVNDGSCSYYTSGCTNSSYVEYNPSANYDDGSCATPIVYGCTNSSYLEYNPSANVDNSSCSTLRVGGCMNMSANNYNTYANVDDGSCTYDVPGCTNSDYLEYDSLATVDNGTCTTIKISGCDNPSYLEYNPSVNYDDGSCETYIVNGCMNSSYLEYNLSANVDNGSCSTLRVSGCMDMSANNYNTSANVDDGNCTYTIYGCTNSSYVEYNASANTDDGSCLTSKVYGCTNSEYLEYNPLANTDNMSCSTQKVEGCTSADYVEYSPYANSDNGSCATLIVRGCTDSDYTEYNQVAVEDDGSCSTLKVYGCTNPDFMEYDSSANTDDMSCFTSIVSGCMDESALNYNPLANTNTICTYNPITLLSIDSTSSSGTYTENDTVDIFAHFDGEISPGSTMDISLNSGGMVRVNTKSDTSTLYGIYTVGANDFALLLNAVSISNVSILDTHDNVYTDSYEVPDSPYNISDSVSIQIGNEDQSEAPNENNSSDSTAPLITNIQTSTTQTTATITWDTNETATSTVNYGTTSGYGAVSSSDVSTQSHSFTLEGLTPNTTYHFRLSSWDAASNLVTSTDETFTTLTAVDATAPDAPFSFTANVSNTSVALSWQNPTDQDFDTVTIRRSASSYPSSIIDGTGVVSDTTSVSYSDTGLANGTYYYSIFAKDTSGNVSEASNIFAIVNVMVTNNVVQKAGSVSKVETNIKTNNIITTDSNINKSPKYIFTTPLSLGKKNSSDTLSLQKFLNENGYAVSLTGPGSKGKETDYFGPATRNALAKFQKDSGITPAIGILGPKTMEYINNYGLSESVINTGPKNNTDTKPVTSCEIIPSTYIEINKNNVKRDVILLEAFLNAYESAGLEVNGIYEKSDYNAVVKFQEKYASSILHPSGLSKGTGYVYARTIQQMKIVGCR